MTDRTPHSLERQLELARSAYTPRAELRERVLDNLLHDPSMTNGPLTALDGSRDAAGSGRPWLGAAAPMALAAVGFVSLGFIAGWQASRAYDEPPPLPPVPRVVAQDSIIVPDPLALPAYRPDAFVAAPLAKEAVTRPPPPPRVSRAARPHSPVPHDSGSVREELALLQRAERAVRAGNAALGLALIAELEVGYPRSKLLEERRAVELMGHCAAGATDSRARADRFLREQPRSIYAARIEELCSASTTSSQR
jgi:hypothetical protein